MRQKIDVILLKKINDVGTHINGEHLKVTVSV